MISEIIYQLFSQLFNTNKCALNGYIEFNSERMELRRGGVLLQDNSEIVAIIPSVQEKIDFINEQYELDIEQVNVDTEVMSEYKTKVIEYISGYVVKKMKCKVKCQKCIDCLTTAKPTDSSNLISVKDYGNFMVYPSTFVKKICEIAEKTMLIEIEMVTGLVKIFSLTLSVLRL